MQVIEQSLMVQAPLLSDIDLKLSSAPQNARPSIAPCVWALSTSVARQVARSQLVQPGQTLELGFKAGELGGVARAMQQLLQHPAQPVVECHAGRCTRIHAARACPVQLARPR